MDTLAKNKLNKNIFREYDIRGQIGKEWCLNNNFEEVYLIGRAIGEQLKRQHYLLTEPAKVIVGRDGRLSSPSIADQLIKGLLSTGCSVIDLGVTATPVVYFSLAHLGIENALMITGSHNPPDHNGIKIVYGLKPLSGLEIKNIFKDIEQYDLDYSYKEKKGNYKSYNNIIIAYQKAIVNNVQLQRTLNIGIDSSNGATSLFSESLFSALGCNVTPLFCKLDGTFPNHSPDPTSPKNLEALIKSVTKNNLDIGIAFDGDGDRVIAVDNKGQILWPDRIIMLLSQRILQENPKATVVYDVKCSFLLPKIIEAAGGKTSMCISGHSILKMEMARQNAIMAGEFSGHIILRDRWSNFDDGPYVAARLLEELSKTEQSCHEIFSQFPKSFSTPECKISFDSPQQADNALEQFIGLADFPKGKISLIDGLRIDYDDGWGLIRSSNTSASLTFRFEATTQQRQNEIQQQFNKIIAKTDFQHKLIY